MSTKVKLLILCCASAVLLSLPWLVPGMGLAALVGFVPLLCADRIARACHIKGFMWMVALCFLIWNVATTFWVSNATFGGAVTAFLFNTMWMTLIFAAYRISRKVLGGILPYLFLAAWWIASEKLYLDATVSWPWLTLGNAFAGTSTICQWYEYTGTLGGSAWVWSVNLAVFGMMCALADGTFIYRRQFIAAVTGLIAIIVVPIALSLGIYHREASASEKSVGKIGVCIIQPNFDPYQKFTSMTQAQQNQTVLDMLSDGIWYQEAAALGDSGRTVLAILPETFTSDLNMTYPDLSSTVSTLGAFFKDYPLTTCLTGASAYSYFYCADAPSPSARKLVPGLWYESHNSAVTFTMNGFSQIYHKSKLVVGTEFMPFPKFFYALDDKLGGVMGRCIGQKEISLLHAGPAPMGCAICYESVFGDYCRDYVNKGAQLMTVITNDAWWGDTPGYKQHFNYSKLRAIELRRDIARCANTGISGFINRRGDVVSSSSWWTRELMTGSVNLYEDKTFFVEHGDITGRLCCFLSALFGLLIFVRLVLRRVQK